MTVFTTNHPDTLIRPISPATLAAFEKLERIPVCSCCQIIEVDETGDLCLDCHSHKSELVALVRDMIRHMLESGDISDMVALIDRADELLGKEDTDDNPQ